MTRIHLSLPPHLQEMLLGPTHLDRLRQLGELSADGEDAPARGDDLVLDVDVLVTSWGSPMLPAVRQAHDRLGMVAHTAGSVRRVVPRSLIASGVRVSHAAAAMADAVAELALTMCLILLRHVHLYDRAFVAGNGWTSAETHPHGSGFGSRRVGVVGASRTGRSFLRMSRGLGADDLIVTDPYLSEPDAAALGVQRVDLEELLRSSDVVSIHAPLTDETRHMIGARELALLHDDAVLVNTARSALIDEPSLLAEARSGRLRIGLDVFETEPLPADYPLVGLSNVLLTPHRGGATDQARRQQGEIAVAEVERFLRRQPLQHEVTTTIYERLA